MTTGYHTYRQTQTNTADRSELLLMLYDGALRFTRQAITAIAAHNVPAKCEAISRAVAIITELHATLDHEIDAQLTDNLAALYLFCLESYTKANAEGSATPLEAILPVLETLREGWGEAVRQVRAQGRSSQAEPTRLTLSVVAG
ncbi:MAG: flagellar export chaperone FliS [Deltaproteobacteria bacterium]|nr:flagellar export chaperone FliS [Deltaproteobacteria bacterium]NCS73620.1 flagellar export chaperone FliS [Deltaproteobacteria bacterium]